MEGNTEKTKSDPVKVEPKEEKAEVIFVQLL